ncbi:MAG: hypothetical protein ABIP55_16190, partial [Tepidisphaeraceae bacterium]
MIASAEPHCGRCGYPVRGLPTLACPECGGDLRNVGIVAPGIRPRATGRERVGYWTILFFIAMVPLWIMADNLIRWHDSTTTLELKAAVGDYRLDLSVKETGYAGPLRSREITLSVNPPSSASVSMQINGRTLAYSYLGGGGTRVKGS